MEEKVDVGAFICPRWYAEGLMILIALEAKQQGKLRQVSWEQLWDESDDWLAGNGFAPLKRKAQPERARQSARAGRVPECAP